ncbi:hypothetical protein lerEdw1_010154 [Lerista edwardsae]|nr:hypothetical protein lerEdw1_010154 [Lerista edwardsae]
MGPLDRRRMPEAPLKLPVLIRTIRAARTQAEERELVQRESAVIRGAFRDDEASTRASNLAKLLYLHLLGYPAHFGQGLLQEENSAVQRHRATILACLTDLDPTVKRRALQLSFALVNSSNVRATVKELLGFLDTCAPDLKADCTSGIFLAAEKFAPNKRWHIDTILQVLTTAGSYVRDDAVPNVIHLIGGVQELHSYAVQQLYSALAQDLSQQPLVQVATWCIGEYGNLLLDSSCEEVEPKQVDPEEILSLLERVLQSHLSLPATRGYALTALMKLGTRLQGSDINRIRSLVSIYCSCHDIELQQRAVEYNALFRKYDHLRGSLLEKMPLVDKTGYSEEGCEKGQNEREDVAPSVLEVAPPGDRKQEESNQVSDLLDILGGPLDFPPSQPSTGAPVPEPFLDLLGDLKPPAASAPSGLAVYERDGLLIEFSMERPPLEPTLLLITATVSNTAPGDVTSFSLQVAVPKSFQVELLAPSSTTVPGQRGTPITQLIRVLNPRKVPLRMRLRLTYILPSGSLVQQIEEINSFPEAAWK